MYVAPESKLLLAMANVVSTSPSEPVATDDPDGTPEDEF